MSKRILQSLVVSSLLMLAFAVPASAQCSGLSCQLLSDTPLNVSPSSGSPWTWGDSTDWQYQLDRCAYGGNTYTNVARLAPGYGLYQDFTVNNNYTSYSIRLDAYFSDAGGGANDEIEVHVQNLSTGQSEQFSFNAGSYGNCASVVGFTLNNQYDYANTRVLIRRHNSSQSTMDIDVDNIAFFGRFY